MKPLSKGSYGAPNFALMQTVGDEVPAAYVKRVLGESVGVPILEDLSLLYTPLHGTGNISVCCVLSSLDVRISEVHSRKNQTAIFQP